MTILHDVANLAVAAGAAIMTARAGGKLNQRSKSDQSPVTDADMAADAVISAGLRRLEPHTLIVSEEDGVAAVDVLAAMRRAGRCWIVDPLDGTRDFVAGTSDFTVNIALVEAGEPVLGCVYAPARGELYVGTKGHGALKGAGVESLEPIRTSRIDTNKPLVLLSRFHKQGEQERLAKWLGGARFQHVGSSYKYCVIASGAADLAVRYSPTSLWDTAAAHCVLNAAGGGMIGIDGEALVYDGHALVNPGFIAYGDERALEIFKSS